MLMEMRTDTNQKKLDHFGHFRELYTGQTWKVSYFKQFSNYALQLLLTSDFLF